MDESADTGAQKTNIANLYNRVAPLYGRVGPDGLAHAGQQLVKRVGITRDARVLDVGTGRGANLFPAAEAVGPNGRVIGIDLAEGMLQETVAEIKRRRLQNAEVLQMDAEQLTFADASFDYVLCGFAIFLFPHLDQALSGFFRVLCPGGKLGISVARNPDALSQWYGQHITEYHERYHFPLNAGGNKLDYEVIPSHLTHAGFTDVQVLREETTWVYADTEEWWDAKWTHGTRYSLEHMSPDILAQFKSEVFARLQEYQQPDGIHEDWHMRYFIGTK